LIFGLFLLFILTFVEIFCTKRTLVYKEHKNILTTLLVISSIIVSMLIYFYQEGTLNGDNLTIFLDWKLYAALSINSLSFFIIRKNYEINGENITAIQFSMFSSLILVIIISYFFSGFLGFNDALNIKYTSINQMLLFLSIYLILIVVFFWGKFKNQNIPSMNLLIVMSIMASLSSFFNTKMMQIYNGYLMYTLLSISSLLLFSSMILYKKEHKKIKSIDKKNALTIMASWGALSPIYIFVNTVMPVEFLAIFKRTLSIVSGFIWDKFLSTSSKSNLNLKDFIVIGLIIFTTVVYYNVTS
jgi:hypothetical protein